MAPMDPPPPPATNPIPSSIPHASYGESVESSPRSRTTETWDDRESLSAVAPGGSKLRLMCSYGGHIIPRPHDKSLSYVGGDTRLIVVDRNISLGELQTRLSRNLLRSQPFTLKYQLPNEDLDSLISVTSDEDLENMIDEFDRICATSSVAKSNRLRVFLFMNMCESASSIDSILDGSVKSEDWFFNALNGSKTTAFRYSDAKSVSSLLGLDLTKNQKSDTHQTSQRISDSMVFDASSSFGSTTSSLANLPPIRVRVEGGGGGGVDEGIKVQDQRVASVEEQFAQMGVSAGGKQNEAFATMVSPQPPLATTPMPAATVVVNPGISSGELPERIVDDDERSDQGVTVGYVVVSQNQPQLQTQSQQQQQQKPSAMFDIASPKSASSEGGMLYQEQFGQNNPRAQGQQKASEAGYIMHSQFEQQQLQQQLQQLHQQQQQLHQNQQQHQQNQQNHQNQQQHQQNRQNHHQQQHQQHQQQQQHQQHQQHQQQQEHLQQQQQQQQEHLQQQQQQQHQQQQQQQHQQQNHQQQFVHPGMQHYIQQSHNTVPISQYYHLYPPPMQRHQPQLDQQQYPFYFIPPTTRQPQQVYNMSVQQATYTEPSNAAPSSLPQTPPAPAMHTNPSAYNNKPITVAPANPEMASGDYRTAQSIVQLAPGQHQQQYMPYSQVLHAPHTMSQPQNLQSATNSSYVFEYSDPAHAQTYSTQLLPHPASYQTMVSSSQMMMLSDASSGQNPSDNMKRQGTTQAQ